MPIKQETLEEILRKAFPEAELVVKDLAGDDDHYRVEIGVQAFAGKSKIAQHKEVQQILKPYNIHAVSIKTYVPN